MKNSLTFILTFILFFPVYSQTTVLTVNPTITPSEMAKQIMGPGVNITGATYKTFPNAKGTFNGVGSNLGLNKGIILCTGNINTARGPNFSTMAGGPNSGALDAEMTAHIGANTEDCAILEFNFTPIYDSFDSVRIKFVWGSEEYPEFVGQYNDGFAIWIIGGGAATYNYPPVYPLSTSLSLL